MPVAPDTIVAVSTPPGRGGIGVVRLSGPRATAVAQELVRFATPYMPTQAHGRARFAHVVDADGGVVDEAVVTTFLGPHSYTGEDLVEVAAHGAPVVLDFILRRALTFSAAEGPVRLAEAGEFSRRAFLAGRLDLTQAEAVHDLIAAQTMAQARTAAQQLGGALARRIAPAKEKLVHLIAMLEAGMDFATGELDDVDTMPPSRIADALDVVTADLAALERTFAAAHLARTGARVALVGRPNAGKSSLFNRLLERERAIVTAAPGTTRDTLEEAFALDGIPLRLVDTAGLRAGAADEAEELGIARSREAVAEADLVLVVEDASAGESAVDAGMEELLAGRAVVRVKNKMDLVGAGEGQATARASTPQSWTEAPDGLAGTGVLAGPSTRLRLAQDDGEGQATAKATADAGVLRRVAPQDDGEGVAVVETSALTGEGMDELRAAVLAQLRAGGADAAEAALTNHRQHAAVEETLGHLRNGAQSNVAAMPHEIVLLDLHEALRTLDTLTGVTTSDDILALIFSTFCIGK